jgi:hypothetical protein
MAKDPTITAPQGILPVHQTAAPWKLDWGASHQPLTQTLAPAMKATRAKRAPKPLAKKPLPKPNFKLR